MSSRKNNNITQLAKGNSDNMIHSTSRWARPHSPPSLPYSAFSQESGRYHGFSCWENSWNFWHNTGSPGCLVYGGGNHGCDLWTWTKSVISQFYDSTEQGSGHDVWHHSGHSADKAWVDERCHILHYIILNNGILKSNSLVFPRSKGYISQHTPYGVYGLIVYEMNEVNIILIIVKNYIMSVWGLDSGYMVK